MIINVPGFYFIENWNEYKTPIALPTFLRDNFYKKGSLINKYYEEYLNDTLKKLSAEIVGADWRNKAFIVKPPTDNGMLL